MLWRNASGSLNVSTGTVTACLLQTCGVTRDHNTNNTVTVVTTTSSPSPPLSSSQHEQSSSTLMSDTHTATAASSPNFQLIFDDALKAYENLTQDDLLAHPLTAQLQTCDSPSAILLLLQERIQELNSSQTCDERLTNWLDPTVNVLYAFSDALGDCAGLVCFKTWNRLRSKHSS